MCWRGGIRLRQQAVRDRKKTNWIDSEALSFNPLEHHQKYQAYTICRTKVASRVTEKIFNSFSTWIISGGKISLIFILHTFHDITQEEKLRTLTVLELVMNTEIAEV
jgi:hypothetical protein